MNLAELADLVCETVRKPDSDSVAACKTYLKRRDQMLWDGNLWRDSLFEFTSSLDPDAAFDIQTNPLLADSGIVLLPRSIDRVLALRKSDGVLPVQNMERFFMDTLDGFAQTGAPCEFALLSPVVWQFNTVQKLWIYNAGEAVSVTVRAFDTISGEVQTQTFAVTATPQIFQPVASIIPDVSTIEDVFKNTSFANISLAYGASISSLTAFSAILATETRMQKYQRVRLFPRPTSAISIRALVKRKYLPITDDYEEPRLRQAENVLIAYATGDMLRRSNKFGMANEAYAEGAALLAKLENIEFFQQAQRMQLVPEIEGSGFGSDVDFAGGTKGYW